MSWSRRNVLLAGLGACVAWQLPPLRRAAFLPLIAHKGFAPSSVNGWNVGADVFRLAPGEAWKIEQALDLLKPAAYHTWGLLGDTQYTGRVPAIYSTGVWDRAKTRAWLQAHPGDTWMLHNEPEDPGQASESPATAVATTLEFLDMAEDVGQPFQWCAPSVTCSMVYDGLAWLGEYMRLLQQARPSARPDYWCVHPYRSPTLARFWQSWRCWQEFYAVRGSGMPVVISEVCAEASSLADQVAVMNACRALLDAHEVAGVFWYIALRNPGDTWSNTALCALDTENQTVLLTDLGRHWADIKPGGIAAQN